MCGKGNTTERTLQPFRGNEGFRGFSQQEHCLGVSTYGFLHAEEEDIGRHSAYRLAIGKVPHRWLHPIPFFFDRRIDERQNLLRRALPGRADQSGDRRGLRSLIVLLALPLRIVVANDGACRHGLLSVCEAYRLSRSPR